MCHFDTWCQQTRHQTLNMTWRRKSLNSFWMNLLFRLGTCGLHQHNSMYLSDHYINVTTSHFLRLIQCLKYNHFWFICFHYVISACCLVSPSTHRTTKHECCLLSRHIQTELPTWGLLSIQLLLTRFPLDLQLHTNTNPHTRLPINTFRGTVFSRTLSRLSKPHLCWRWPLDYPAHGKGDQGDFTPSTLFFRSITFP